MTSGPDHEPPGKDAPEKPHPVAPDAADVEVWWGSCSSWALLPAWVLGLVLAGALAFLTWVLLRHTAFGNGAALGVAGVGGLVVLWRWAACYFGWNYRLTNRRLFVEHGVLRPAILHIDLVQVAHVEVRATWLDRRLGVGDLTIHFVNDRLPRVVLAGVFGPKEVAQLFRQTLQAARQVAAVEKRQAPR